MFTKSLGGRQNSIEFYSNHITCGFQVNLESKTIPRLVTVSEKGTTAPPILSFTDHWPAVITLFTVFAGSKTMAVVLPTLGLRDAAVAYPSSAAAAHSSSCILSTAYPPGTWT